MLAIHHEWIDDEFQHGEFINGNELIITITITMVNSS